MTVRSDTVFVAANVFPGNALKERPAYIGVLRQTASGNLVALSPVELPHGDFQFAYPRIVAEGHRLHLVWAEFRSRPRTVDQWITSPVPATALWHAVLDHGVWSAPERIASSDWFGWTAETGGVAIEANGTLHVAVWKGDTDSIPRVHDLRLAGGRWRDSSLPPSGLNQATAIATRGDTIVIAVVADAPDTERVMVVESVDHGTRWMKPVVASSRARRAASVTRLAFALTQDGQMLAIGEKPANSFYLDTIRLIRVRRAIGVPLRRSIAPPPTVDDFQLAAARCGSVVMLLRTFAQSMQVFQQTFPPNSSATPPRPLMSNAAAATFPAVTSGPRSTIAILSYNTERNAPLRTVAVTVPVCAP